MADGPRLRVPTHPRDVEANRQVPAVERADAWEQLARRLPPVWAVKILEILEQAERARTNGELGSTFVLRGGRVSGTRVRRPDEHVG